MAESVSQKANVFRHWDSRAGGSACCLSGPVRLQCVAAPTSVGLNNFPVEGKYATHWAFTKPVRSPLPKGNDKSWPKNALDYFVLMRLEADGLHPSPEADRYTLIRRLSFDLTGLPPTPEQVQQFVDDESPQAYENLVDRLLDSPHYGERWARVWMDLARYADTQGYEKDSPRTVWLWRDWVIQALNDDMPYDQFTTEQLAGDLLPEANSQQVLATVFHRNTMTNTEGGTDDEEFRVAAVKDRVDTTGLIWLGLSLGCAKCHSHKPSDPRLSAAQSNQPRCSRYIPWIRAGAWRSIEILTSRFASIRT